MSSVQSGIVRARHPEMCAPVLPALHRGPLERRSERAVPLPGVQVQDGVQNFAVQPHSDPATIVQQFPGLQQFPDSQHRRYETTSVLSHYPTSAVLTRPRSPERLKRTFGDFWANLPASCVIKNGPLRNGFRTIPASTSPNHCKH